jgi:hypothetical protein
MAAKASTMKLKLDDKENVVVQDGKPVFVAEDGKEIAFDYAATLGTISRLNGEAKAHRERAETAEAALKNFEGIEDPGAAREALNTVKNLDSKKLFDAGKVEEIKTEAKEAYEKKLRALEEQYKPVITERDSLKGALNKEIIGGSFTRSKFIADKLAIPPDLVESRFGSAFSLEDGRVIAKDASGQLIYSRAKPGEVAGFDEALEYLVDSYPHRDTILKSSGASGGGASGSASGTLVGGKKPITRAAFDALDPAAKAAAAKDMAIVD